MLAVPGRLWEARDCAPSGRNLWRNLRTDSWHLSGAVYSVGWSGGQSTEYTGLNLSITPLRETSKRSARASVTLLCNFIQVSQFIYSRINLLDAFETQLQIWEPFVQSVEQGLHRACLLLLSGPVAGQLHIACVRSASTRLAWAVGAPFPRQLLALRHRIHTVLPYAGLSE